MMMRNKKWAFTLLVLLIALCSQAQRKKISIIQDIKNWQQELNKEYKNKATSPLNTEDFKTFAGHDFYDIDTAYIVTAKMVLTNSTEEIPFKTTTAKVSMHTKYAVLFFSIKGEKYQLSVYQSKDLMKTTEYADYLFLPFFDGTTGYETYGAGRYIDLRIPKKGNKVIIDFNKAYNPYCAYSRLYSCPKVPAENELKIKISAGVKYTPNH
jgi:uncharacterized protein